MLIVVLVSAWCLCSRSWRVAGAQRLEQLTGWDGRAISVMLGSTSNVWLSYEGTTVCGSSTIKTS